MKAELTKQFVSKMVRRVFIFTVLLLICTTITHSIDPIVTNELALTQMENDNVMYVIMTTYNRLKVVFNIGVSVIILWFVCTIFRDAYKFTKNIYNVTNEKEN